MIKTNSKFRIKFVLPDGRKVYTSTRGVIDEKTIEQMAHLDFALIAKNAAYSEDLNLFSADYRFFERNGIPFVRVKTIVREPASKPIDPDAFTQNGKVKK